MNRKKIIAAAIVLVLVLAIGGILAYFTDVKTESNKFKMGSVSIVVDEPGWPKGETVDIVPGQEVDKDPLVINKGDGNVYAFVEVIIPRASVKVGNATQPALTELFTLRHITDATTGATAEGINAGWVEIESAKVETPTTVTHVFAYGTATQLTPIAAPTPAATPGEEPTYQQSTKVFDKVKFVDVKETAHGQTGSIQGNDYEVVVRGYGIQADGLSSKVPSEVWPSVK